MNNLQKSAREMIFNTKAHGYDGMIHSLIVVAEFVYDHCPKGSDKQQLNYVRDRMGELALAVLKEHDAMQRKEADNAIHE